jgi:hypothetical protein
MVKKSEWLQRWEHFKTINPELAKEFKNPQHFKKAYAYELGQVRKKK